MELSTAVSDFILCVSSFGTAVSILPITSLGAFGFLIMSVAAGFGTARFSMSAPSQHIVSCHASMSWLAGTLGIALMAAGFYRKYGSRILATVHVGVPAAYTILKFIIAFNAVIDTALTTFISSSAVLSIGIYSLIQRNPFGMMGAFCFMMAAAVGTNGELFGIKRVDWFHYLLAFSGVVLMRAFHFELPVEKEKTS
ncbi:uncharacterized protein LOC579487 [Strongylocentrotus purpuratus]|uniref:Uncharacterized protein n=1 Tax=Strongylocentrotus purpuratus TaxID=7668 RepID=A0A7M7RFT3_STRPU|nr:uncharacterized protein LOC579487 [Strongylocentrotus purpuratus]|eukprot:XP_011664094.1 PREDICTED: uncharacterized protein LOC579487 [Strongylocentrotus purpuratus]